MTTFEKLQKKIKDDLNIETDWFQRRRLSYFQKKAGMWLWVATIKLPNGTRGGTDIGSTYSATELLSLKKKLIIDSNGEIYPKFENYDSFK